MFAIRPVTTCTLLFALLQVAPPAIGQGEQETRKVDRHFINAERFTIPFQVATDASIVEVQLFASTDKGRTWNIVGRQHPRQNRFAFEPREDGEYWLSARTVDQSSRVHGRFSLGSPVPQLKLVVDRRSPILKLEARAEPIGRVHLVWDASDEHLDHSTFQLEYRTVNGPWQPITIKPSVAPLQLGRLRGEMYWYPDTVSRVLTVRGEISDRAGNRVVKLVDRVFLPRIANRRDSPGDQGSDVDNSTANHIWPRGETQSVPSANSGISGLATDQTRGQHHDSNIGNEVSYEGVSGQVHPGVGTHVQIGKGADHPASVFDAPNGEPVSMTAKTRFRLDYDLKFVGPQGAADVQLWCTRDRNSSWEKWGSDRDLQSPLSVEVDAEGLYGFRIVIVGKNGLSSPTPKPNTPADLWVGVDLTAPVCRLTTAAIGRGKHSGHVELRWEVVDQQLAPEPITLSFSLSAKGPWQVIATGLRDDGQYFWKIDNSVPPSVFVRLEVVDAAGHRQESVLQQAVDTRQVAPRGRILGVAPVE
jgi:hypothetical protein